MTMKSHYDFANAKRGPVNADQAFTQSDLEFHLDTAPDRSPAAIERCLLSAPKRSDNDPAFWFARGVLAAVNLYPVGVIQKQ